ncbi:MAG: nucleoside hydrolase [Oscillospiraceae bacterium]
MTKRPLIIDCDPGVDDAEAIMILNASNKFDIKGITPVHGNVALETTARNALYLRGLYQIDCPVAKGAENALIKVSARAEYAHGANGLAGMEYVLDSEDYHEKAAWDFIYDTALLCGGELELIALGPLTNVAIACMKYPKLASMIKQLTIMGGGATAGNTTPYAEFNIWQDPHAMAFLLEQKFRKFVVVDLDACYSAYLTADEAAEMSRLGADNPISELMAKIYNFRSGFWNRKDRPDHIENKFEGKLFSCDATAAVVASFPEVATVEKHFMLCEYQSQLTCGQTIVDWRHRFDAEANVELVRSLDREEYKRHYFECANSYRVKTEAPENA